METIQIKGKEINYKFKILPFKNIKDSEIENCISIVAFYKQPSIYSMFFIRHLESLKSLENTFDLSLSHLLFVKKLSESENAQEIINDIIVSNPEHKFE
jgi:hypothetical protein